MKQAVATPDAPQAAGLLSQAVISNGMVYVAGQVHVTPGGDLVEGSTSEKVAQIMKNISAILEAAGCSLNDSVKGVVYVTDMALMPELNRAYPTYFKEPLPAREAVCVSALPLGAQIEISVVAEVPAN